MENIIRFIHDRFSSDISIYDDSFLEKTINYRMVLASCPSTNDYLTLLDKMPEEALLLIESFTNSYSEFFRNSLTFALLKQIIFPKIFNENEKLHSHQIRIWSAGCAAGQEAYSLAILAHDLISERHSNTSFRIFATDISSKQLEDARLGVYDVKTIQQTDMGFVNTYFTNKGQSYSISEKLKKYIDFSFYDLLDKETSAPPVSIFGGFDIIMCCNVLFYYKSAVQGLILNKLSRSLNVGGFLLTGEAEMAIVRKDINFRQFSSPTGIFVKV